MLLEKNVCTELIRQLKKILEILPTSDRIKLLGLLGMMFIGAGLEVLGIGMLPAFISVVASPEKVLEIPLLEPLWSTFNIQNGNDLLLFGSILLILVFIFKNIYLVLFRYIESRFVFNRYATLGTRLFTKYMTAPYVFSLSRNSAELLRNITQEAHLLILNVLKPSIKIIKNVIMISAIILLLVAFEPLITLMVIILLGGGGALFLKSLKYKVKVLGKQAQNDRGIMIQTVNEGIGGLKDITVLNREKWFIHRLKKHIKRYASSQSFIHVASGSTKPILETISVAGMLLIVLLLYIQDRSLDVILPVLTLFGAATIRLMPALQETVSSYNSIRYYIYSVKVIFDDLKETIKNTNNTQPSVSYTFQNLIVFSNTSFFYPDSATQAIKSINLSIRKGEAVGLVGPSGAGKTTVVDLLLGLLEPQEGEITVDGNNIFENPVGWRKNVGYIPQFIYLIDNTLKRNIALGLPDEEIDDSAVLRAIEAAQLTEVVNNLEKGLDTIIGEHGVRLSGGQRQRIGIARALYHNPSVLIMDEATSALDNVTEKFVIDAIEHLKGKKTLIMIAHRLSTVQNCDILYYMKDGKILDSGNYNDLLSRNHDFKKMAMGET